MSIYIVQLKAKVDQGKDEKFKGKLKTFVKIRCCFC